MTGEAALDFHVITVDMNGFIENHYGEPDSSLEATVKTLAGAAVIAAKTLGGFQNDYEMNVSINGWRFLISSRRKGGFVAIAWREKGKNVSPGDINDYSLIEKLNAMPEPFFDATAI